MAKVIITRALREEVFKAENLFLLMKSLENSPQKGKAVGNVGKIVIKELKHEKWRFYFITDGHLVKFGTADKLTTLLIKFVRMSEKKDQKRVIREIKHMLNSLGFDSL